MLPSLTLDATCHVRLYIIWYLAQVSALGKVCQFYPELPNVPDAVALWLNYLPLKSDLEEAVVVNEQLCVLLETYECKATDPGFRAGCAYVWLLLRIVMQQYDNGSRCSQRATFKGLRGNGVRDRHPGSDIGDASQNGTVPGAD